MSSQTIATNTVRRENADDSKAGDLRVYVRTIGGDLAFNVKADAILSHVKFQVFRHLRVLPTDQEVELRGVNLGSEVIPVIQFFTEVVDVYKHRFQIVEKDSGFMIDQGYDHSRLFRFDMNDNLCDRSKKQTAWLLKPDRTQWLVTGYLVEILGVGLIKEETRYKQVIVDQCDDFEVEIFGLS